MNSKEKIISFMQAKLKKFQELLKEDVNYYNEQDEAIIQKWSIKKSDEVWKKLKDNINKYKALALTDRVCPFCIYYEDCNKCKYAKNHDICIDPNSDVSKISKKYTLKTGFNIVTSFNQKFYLEVLRNIYD
jgi:hypothetical protein